MYKKENQLPIKKQNKSEKQYEEKKKSIMNKEKIEKVLPPDLLKRDKRYIEKYIIDAMVQYNSLNKFKNDEINLLDLKV